MPATITVLIDLSPDQRFHVATIDALHHAIGFVGADAIVDVVPTDEFHVARLGDAVVVGPGSPYRDPVAAEAAITSARERGIPLLAT